MSDYVDTTIIQDKLKGCKEIRFKYDDGFIQILRCVGKGYTDNVYEPMITADLRFKSSLEIDLIIEHLHKLIDKIKHDIKGEQQ